MLGRTQQCASLVGSKHSGINCLATVTPLAEHLSDETVGFGYPRMSQMKSRKYRETAGTAAKKRYLEKVIPRRVDPDNLGIRQVAACMSLRAAELPGDRQGKTSPPIATASPATKAA